MPSFFHKPENALKRAREFIDVDKKDSALEVLNDVIRSRKHRQKWTEVHERIMLLYTDLCVQLQRSSFAKDGLYQYRNICKEVAPNSFEKVIKKFLELAENKANSARQQSEATVLQGVEDLDAVVTPESLLLSTVSGEGAKERTDRVLLTPWVKFLWESYRNMLELLKNNLVNLSVYSDVAKSAFKFCLNYQRRMEFRKLCDILRNHLSQAEKYQSQPHTLKLDQQEVITGLVDVRFEQLESSISVDLWQEAFRAIEEIHKLLNMSGKSPKASLLENFYSRQAKVYMMAKNQLFHAAALHKLFVLRKEQKKTLTKDEAVITASQVLLATLAVPIEPIPSEADRFLEVDDNSRDKARRLAALLRMDTPPTRATLMKDMLSHDVLQLLSPELQQLYRYLEVDFDPLHLCSNVIPILESLDSQESMKQYVEPLREITLVRLIKQVSQVYESIELSRLVELAPFATTTDLEKVVVETATSNNIQVRIDHRTKSLCFGMDMNFSHHLDSPEGPHVQNMPSKVLCSQLTMMSQALQQAVHIISASDIAAEQLALSKKACQDYQAHSRGDHRRVVQRASEIEARKEFIENKRRAIDKKKEDERRQRLEQERVEEMRRLNREAVQREKERTKKEIEEVQLKMKLEKVDALKNTAVGKRAFADVTSEDLKNMDAEVIFSKQLKQIEKEKRDKETKLKTQEKKVDYTVRAQRLAELQQGLIEKQYEAQSLADIEFHEKQETEMIEVAKKERKEAEDASTRFKLMKEDVTAYKQTLQSRRNEAYEAKMAEFQARVDVARAECLAQRKKERKKRRKAEEEAAKKEEAVREAQLKREEEERKREEQRKKREEEREEERLASLKREQELEEKRRRREAMEEQQGEWRQSPRAMRKEEDNWRGGRDEEPRREDGWGSRGAPRGREDGWGSRRGDDGDRRDGESSWRRDDRGPPPRERDDRGPPPRDMGRDWDYNRDQRPRDFDRGRGDEHGWRGRESDRSPGRGDRGGDKWRGGDQGGFGADDRGWRGRESDRSPGRGDRGGDKWMGGDRGDDRGWRGRESDRSPGRGDQGGDRGGWKGRESDRSPGRGDQGGDKWRGGDRGGLRADDRGWKGRESDRSPGRGDQGGDKWRGGDGGGLGADDRGWRGRESERSPGHGDRGRDPSPRQEDDGFEVVRRR